MWAGKKIASAFQTCASRVFDECERIAVGTGTCFGWMRAHCRWRLNVFWMNASVLQVETKTCCDECERIAGGD